MSISKKASLTIPCHWNKEVVKKIISISKSTGGLEIKEIYGSLASGPIGHGRSKNSVKDISRDEAIDFRLFLKENNIDFTYLLNAPFKLKDDKLQEVDEYLKWIINEFKPDALTIASYELMKHIRQIDNNIPIHISTIAGVKDSKDLERYLDIHPTRVVPHHDCGKRWQDLKDIAELGNKNGIEVELLATESCLFSCPHREAHYKFLADETKDETFHTCCNTKKINNPRELLLAGGTVRPEDEEFYENLGVKYFKITGRSKPEEWLPEVVEAYSKGSYDGNLIRLLGIDPTLEAEKWIYIDNKSLNGFIEKFPQTKNIPDEINYANKWISKLYKEGRFKIKDGTEYNIENENLVLKNLGENTKSIVNNELKHGFR